MAPACNTGNVFPHLAAFRWRAGVRPPWRRRNCPKETRIQRHANSLLLQSRHVNRHTIPQIPKQVAPRLMDLRRQPLRRADRVERRAPRPDASLQAQRTPRRRPARLTAGSAEDFYVEHWKIGTIASDLNVHPDAVRNAIESERFHSAPPLRASVVDPYIGFIRQTLDQHPRLRATRIFQTIRDRGYSGSIVQLRRTVSRLRPQKREPFLQLQMFPGEQA